MQAVAIDDDRARTARDEIDELVDEFIAPSDARADEYRGESVDVGKSGRCPPHIGKRAVYDLGRGLVIGRHTDTRKMDDARAGPICRSARQACSAGHSFAAGNCTHPRIPFVRRAGSARNPVAHIVGIDESDNSTRALAEAFDIARALRAPLTVVHMWEIGAAVGMGDLGGQGNMDWELLEVLQSRQRRRMDELIEPFSKYPNSHVTKVFQDISPAKGLTELSREAQLVIVGSHGRGRLADALLGSVSQNLIHHAECPVLVVR